MNSHRQIPDLQPDNSAALMNLATAYYTSGRLEQAVATFQKVAAIRPNWLDVHVNLGIALAALHRFDEALASHARAAALAPNAATTHLAMGEILLHRQETPAAIESFRQAVTADPKLLMAWNELGTALRTQGQFDQAVACFRKMLEIQPNSAAAYHQLASTGAIKFTPGEINQLSAALNQRNLSLSDRLSMGFTLGKMLDDVARYDEAFARYADANMLAKRSRAQVGERYDPALAHRQFDQIIDAFSPSFFRHRREWGNPCELPVFVVGMPRSGTTLVQQIAAGHPQIYGAGELREISYLARSLDSPDVNRAVLQWTPPQIQAWAQGYLNNLREMKPSAARIIDKMPGNIVSLGLISILFPRARVILCRRDVRDTCLSCYFQYFSTGNTFSFDLAHCAHWHHEINRIAAHWLRAAPLQIMEMQYETLVTDLEGQSRRLIEFLGLPWDPACLEFHRSQNAVMTSSDWQVRQPIYSKSVGRWRHYEKHLGALLEALEY